jgi:hypothetical protein
VIFGMACSTMLTRIIGSHEAYVRNLLVPIITPVQQGGLGYRGVVINCRGCELPYLPPFYISLL